MNTPPPSRGGRHVAGLVFSILCCFFGALATLPVLVYVLAFLFTGRGPVELLLSSCGLIPFCVLTGVFGLVFGRTNRTQWLSIIGVALTLVGPLSFLTLWFFFFRR